MRIDKFLKVSRILKRRTLAAEACAQNKVLVGQTCVKPSYRLKIGDIVSIVFLKRTLTFKVLNLNEHAKKEECENMYEVL
ncbi:MAG: RNA-binding S4 domain-containing protein [Firmicutes bacterium]|nr:RNA-binding S4 domain-containing protein [Bacillota bacterium]